MQTNMYGRYHVNDPNQFFQRDQFWSVAQEPPQTVDPGSAQVTTSSTSNGITTTSTRSARFNPYYTLLHIPGQDDTRVLVGAAVRAVLGERRAEEPHRAHVGVERSRRPTGSCASSTSSRPSRSTVPRSWTRSSSGSTRPTSPCESQTGSKVRLGTLQAIPIGDSILWVRPWYVQAEQTPIPQLSFVVLAYGDQIVRARTLEGALKLAFPDATVDFTTTVGPLTPLGGHGHRADAGAGERVDRQRGAHDRLGLDGLDDTAGASGDGAGAPRPGQPALRPRPRPRSRPTRRTSRPTTPRSPRPSSSSPRPSSCPAARPRHPRTPPPPASPTPPRARSRSARGRRRRSGRRCGAPALVRPAVSCRCGGCG